jgi:hypothetical protein
MYLNGCCWALKRVIACSITCRQGRACSGADATWLWHPAALSGARMPIPARAPAAKHTFDVHCGTFAWL